MTAMYPLNCAPVQRRKDHWAKASLARLPYLISDRTWGGGCPVVCCCHCMWEMFAIE
jgi:hypothetical protein